MTALLIFPPVVAGLIAMAVRREKFNRALLVASAGLHAFLTLRAWLVPQAYTTDSRWFSLDPAGLYFLTITSVLFLAASIYSVGYLKRELRHPGQGVFYESVFVACLLVFLSSMTLICFSQSFEIMWVAVEATTLATAPLIYYHRTPNSLEATWKYLMICSVGIAMALLGTFFLSVAAAPAAVSIHARSPLFFSDLLVQAPLLDRRWLEVAFIFVLVGYGTKMGLAPLHSWLPDAHSESPSVVSALLSGVLLNCAFLAILRLHRICLAAGDGAFSQSLLVVFGLFSMAVAAAFVIKQADYKRMLAYSSVEHMGILSFAVGIGGSAVYGGMLHAVNHSFTKAMLFLLSGNVLAFYHSKSTRVVVGMARVLPWTAALWTAGLFAIVGSPPFGTFLSEFTVLNGAFAEGHVWEGVIYVTLLVIVFIGMVNIGVKMVQGSPGETFKPGPNAEPWWSILPPAVLGVLVLILGVHIPPFLDHRLKDVSAMLQAPAPVSAQRATND